jgi:hypothetical protein
MSPNRVKRDRRAPIQPWSYGTASVRQRAATASALRGARPRRRHMPRIAAKPKCDGSIGTQPAGKPFASTERHCRMPAAYGGDGTWSAPYRAIAMAATVPIANTHSLRVVSLMIVVSSGCPLVRFVSGWHRRRHRMTAR